jgi:hypothetical protein
MKKTGREKSRHTVPVMYGPRTHQQINLPENIAILVTSQCISTRKCSYPKSRNLFSIFKQLFIITWSKVGLSHETDVCQQWRSGGIG